MIKSQKILVSGVTGQVGYHVARHLASNNQVWGLARFRRWGSRKQIEALGIHTLRADLSRHQLDAVPTDFDYVLHFAADTCPRSEGRGFQQNVVATRNLLSHCKAAKAFLHASTAGVYAAHADPSYFYKEEDPLGGPPGYSPHYVQSKIQAEAVVASLGKAMGIPTTIARLNCTYSARGSNQLPSRYLDLLVKHKPIWLPGPKQVVHTPIAVEDVATQASGMLAAAATESTIVNWGGDQASSALQWIEYWAALLDVRADVRFDPSITTPSCALDPAKRLALVGPCRDWKIGMHRMLKDRYPNLKVCK